MKLLRTFSCALLLTVAASSAQAAPAKKTAAKPAPVKAAAVAKAAPVKAAPAAPQGCTSEIVVDTRTGEVLHEKNPDAPLEPASMVKLMSAWVILKHISDGQIALTDPVTVSAKASKTGGSQVYLKEGETFTVDQLLQAMLIQSGNDAAVALAERIGGSTEGFVALMTAEAKELGLTSASFSSPHGLPPAAGQGTDHLSARDFATLSRALLNKFPQVTNYTSQAEATFRDGSFKMQNHNTLLRTFPGTNGLKTGFHNTAGFCLTASAERQGVKLIAVAMGCERRPERDTRVASLLGTAFASYQPQKLATQGTPVQGTKGVPVDKGAVTEVTPVAKDTLNVMLRPEQKNAIQTTIEGCQGFTAPVAPGTACGKVKFSTAGMELGTVELVSPVGVPRLGMLGQLKQRLGF